MIISHTRRFIFNKPMKTAGSSLEVCLYEYLGDGDIVGNNGAENLKLLRSRETKVQIREASHVALAEMVRGYGWKCIDYTHFTVVRNPWDRAVSLFYWRNPDYREAPLREARAEFQRWVGFGLRELENSSYSWMGYPIADVVLKYEMLNQGMRELSHDLGLETEVDMGAHRDKSGLRPGYSRAFTELYDEASWSLVGQVLAADAVMFGYSRDRPWGDLDLLKRFEGIAEPRRRQLKLEHDKAAKASE